MKLVGDLYAAFFGLYLIGGLARAVDFEKLAFNRIKLGLISLERITPDNHPKKEKRSHR